MFSDGSRVADGLVANFDLDLDLDVDVDLSLNVDLVDRGASPLS